MINKLDLSISCIVIFAGLGYISGTGTDVDECQTGEHNCGETARCTNTNGSYYCSCPEQFNTAFSPGTEIIGWGDSCYSIVYSTKIRWEDARIACRERSGDLVAIGSQAEQDWLLAHLLRLSTMLSCDVKWGYWYGLNTSSAMNFAWHWIDGIPLNESIVSWSAGEPNNHNVELCAEIKNGGTLNNLHCETAVPYICERNASVHLAIEYCTGNTTCDSQAQCKNISGSYRCTCNAGYSGDGTTCEDVNECESSGHNCADVNRCKNTNGSFYCSCPERTNTPSSAEIETLGWGASCYSIIDSSKKTWKDAREYCKERSADLVAIGSQAEQDWLDTQLQRVNLVRLTASACGGGWWYGLQRLNSDWQWVDGTPLNTSIVDWSVGEPNNVNGERCVEFTYSGLLNNLRCEADHRYFICELDTTPNGCRDNNTCQPGLANCTNTPGGGHKCTCLSGYSGDGETCTDTNECITDQHNCGNETRCRNTNGSFYCSCRGNSGTTPSEDMSNPGWGESCYSIVYASKQTWNGAREACRAQSGDLVAIRTRAEQDWLHGHLLQISTMLSCDARWSYWYGLFSDDGSDWKWVDETPLNESSVSWSKGEPNNGYREKCAEIAEVGSLNNLGCGAKRPYICKRNATVVDACVDGSICHSRAQCTNTTGEGYRCECNPGYYGSGVNCTDVNECSKRLHNCRSDDRCRNTEGSFYCLCPGQSDSASSAENETIAWGDSCYSIIDSSWLTWADARKSCRQLGGDLVVIETKAEQDWLHVHSPRVADMSACAGGWWYGLHLQDSTWQWVNDMTLNESVVSWHEGEPNNERIDWCAEVVYGGTMNNLACTEKRRYICELDIYVDECNQTNSCLPEAQCTNVPGGYKCSCNIGYTGDGQTCQDKDECESGEENKCDRYSVCHNTHGSYTCTCKEGFSGDGLTCSDIDECMQEEERCGHRATCLNAIGSYVCSCQDGFYWKTCSEPLTKYIRSSDRAGTYAAIILGVVVAVVLLVVIIVVIVRRRRRRGHSGSLFHLTYGKLATGNESPIPPDKMRDDENGLDISRF